MIRRLCGGSVGGLTSARARKRDVEIAIGVSLVAHAVLLAWVVWELAVAVTREMTEPEVEKPPEEVTLLYPEQLLPEPPKPPDPPKPEVKNYIRTTQNTASAAAPERADFVSDRNTVAASEKAPEADGKANLPTQDGIDPERMELADRDYKDGEIREDGATPEPAMRVREAASAPPAPVTPLKPAAAGAVPLPAAAPPAMAEPKPVEVAKAEPLTPLEAMMREQDEGEAARVRLAEPGKEENTAEAVREAPVQAPVVVPEMRGAPDRPPAPPEMRQPEPGAAEAVKRTAGPQDAAAFSPFTRTSKVRGTISNRGEAAVNAAETPVGRYMRQVTGAVEKKWHLLRRRNADAVTFGNLRLRFYVRADGKVEPPTILSDRTESDARMVDFTLQAILEAEIPPIPPDLLPLLDRQRLEVEYDVLIY